MKSNPVGWISKGKVSTGVSWLKFTMYHKFRYYIPDKGSN